MPVTTRNQRINNVASQEKLQAPRQVSNPHVNKKVRPDPNNLLPWFVSVIKKALSEIDQNNTRKSVIKSMLFKCPDSEISKANMEKDLRTVHFDSIRQATELMFFIDQYLPEVYSIASMEKFTEVVYNKIQVLYNQIRTADIKPETDDEYKTIMAVIGVLQEVEKNIIPLLPADQPLKRRRNFVDYTGMDTIEPLDGITDIWTDLTLKEDPDYEPSEDEDDDLDRYVVYDEENEENEENEDEDDEHDYSEDEDYEPEDDEEEELDVYEENEIFEIMVNSKKHPSQSQKYEEPRKVLKSQNHIVFEY
jgi:hypothetical protein